MATPGRRMRLTVEVLPLTEANAHGPYRSEAIAAFKGRKFALPVQLEDTFERVWSQIELRYKTNYLDALQAANFTIHKLQDAYDCDLDLGDTVSSIFEGETDPTRRMIKVVPAFINRDFSVPATSNLRPVYAQKRVRELNGELSNKRRRIEQLGDVQEEVDPTRDQPVPSTESERSREGSLDDRSVNGRQAGSRVRRSHTGGSLVFVNNSQTGQVEFGTSVKEESPELGLPPPAPKVTELASNNGEPNRRKTRSRTRTPRARVQQEFEVNRADEVPETDDAATEDPHVQAEEHQLDPQEVAIRRSPQSTPAQPQQSPPPAATKRRDVYDVPSSPEFLRNQKATGKKTYSRSPRTVTTIQKEVDLLNKSRRLSAHARVNGSTQKPTPTSVSKKARAFRNTTVDDIESTPQEELASVTRRETRAESIPQSSDLTSMFLDNAGQAIQFGNQTPAKGVTSKSAKPGSLKKPSRTALPATPASTKGRVQFGDADLTVNAKHTRNGSESKSSAISITNSVGSASKKLDPDIQARLDRVRQIRMQRRNSPKVVVRRNSVQSQSAGESPVANGRATDIQSVVQSPQAAAISDTAGDTITDKPHDDRHIAVQPAPLRTPLKSPIPLPENVRRLTPNANVSSEKPKSTQDVEVFKKPIPPQRSTRSVELTNGLRHKERDSVSSDRRSTPLRSEIPLANNTKQPASQSKDGSLRRLSGSSETRRVSIQTEIPLPQNVRHMSNSSSAENAVKTNGVTKSGATPSLAPLTTQPKKRGRPPKNAGTQSALNTEATPGTESTKSKSPAEPLPPQASTDEKVEDVAIVISSSESSDDSEDEPDVTPQSAQTTDQSAAELSHQDQAEGTRIENTLTVQQNATEIDPAAHHAEIDAQHAPEVSDVSIEKEDNGSATPWTAESWGFEGLNQSTDATETATRDNDVESRVAAAVDAVSEEAVDSDTEAAGDMDVNSKSRSASAAVSTRSSPAVTRRPARFLSHSPTPEVSASESESEETSATPSKAASPHPNDDKEGNNSDGDSTSDSDETSTSIEDEDTEMPDAAPNATADSAPNALPSSPPRLNNAPASTPLVPETSQPNPSQPIHQTPIPLPPNLGSSQPVSGQTAARRPGARYAGFRTLREQLADAKTTPTASQKKVYDPRMLSLSKLAAKGKGKPMMGVGLDDEESSEESSSSSSDSD